MHTQETQDRFSNEKRWQIVRLREPMGMCLKAVNRAVDDDQSLKFSWERWEMFWRLCRQWEIDTTEFRWVNEGDLISRFTCQAIANALEEHQTWLKAEGFDWLLYADTWRHFAANGGCEQR